MGLTLWGDLVIDRGVDGIVYMATNNVDGKVYIGKTIRTLECRMRGHLAAKYNRPFTNALRKYGVGSFLIEIVDRAATLSALDAKERWWIAQYDCVAPNGYNLTYGGEGGVPSAETRLKMSKARLGKPPSNKGKSCSFPARQGVPISHAHNVKLQEGRVAYYAIHGSTFGGRHHTQDAKEKMRDRKLSPDNRWRGAHHSEDSRLKIAKTTLAQREVYVAASNRRWAKHTEPECPQCAERHDCLVCQRRANQLFLLATYRARKLGTALPEPSAVVKEFRSVYGRHARGSYKKKSVEASRG